MDKFLVTGASSGIGQKLTELLQERNVSVFPHGRTRSKMEGIYRDQTFLASDLTAPGAAEDLVARAVESLGGLDCVIHCAGVGLIKPVADTSDAEFSRILNVNTRATFLVAKASAQVMAEQKRGLFMTIPGILGKAPMKNASAYIASKYAVTGMIKAMGQEYQRKGVRFCLFHFGGVDSPFWDSLNFPVQKDQMISTEVAARTILQAIDLPSHLVLGEVVLQPESHQL